MANFKTGDGNRPYTQMSRDEGMDARLAKCSHSAQLVFTRIIRWGDNLGRGIADPVIVWSRVMPRDPSSLPHMQGWLYELHDAGINFLYEVRGEKFWINPMYQDWNPLRGTLKTSSTIPFPDPREFLDWCLIHEKNMSAVAMIFAQAGYPLLTRTLETGVKTIELNANDMQLNANDMYMSISNHQRSLNIKSSSSSESDAPMTIDDDDLMARKGDENPAMLPADARVQQVASEFTRATGKPVGGRGLTQIALRLAAGWSPDTLSQAIREILARSRKPVAYFSYIDTGLDGWADEMSSPRGHSAPPSAQTLEDAREEEVKAAKIRSAERAGIVHEKQMANDLLEGMTESERDSLLKRCEEQVGAAHPSMDRSSAPFRQCVAGKMRALAVSMNET